MRNLVFVLLLAAVSNGCQLKNQSTSSLPDKPNILFFFTDDQRADALGCAGNPYIETPNIDKLAENGIHLPNTYAK